MDNLGYKNVLITGASRGIGREIALRMAKPEINIFLNYNRSHDDAEDVASLVEQEGAKCILLQADVSNHEDIKRMFKEIYLHTDKIDVLVNNAGVLKKQNFISTTEADWDVVLDTNVKGAFLCAKYAARNMIKNKKGCIINIQSTVTQKILSMQSSYVVSKMGLQGLTQAMAKELGPFNIRVNAVSPGPVFTDICQYTEDEKQEILNLIPLRKHTTGNDIAELVSFLASDSAAQISGQIICVDGGLSL
jgi:3-oxoacyl-[acyl-carrier protein] reductase